MSQPDPAGVPDRVAGFSVTPADLDRDLDAIMAIEEASFVNHPTRESLIQTARGSEVARLFVLREPGGHVVGFCAAWIVAGELHVNSLAILPAWRQRGCGTCLLGGVLAAARREGATCATLEVRRSNGPAIRLYERFGFRQVAARRAYYTNPSEDALILWWNGDETNGGAA
jgi:ribosomal-protein-alanine N-acetyltransferase